MDTAPVNQTQRARQQRTYNQAGCRQVCAPGFTPAISKIFAAAETPCKGMISTGRSTKTSLTFGSFATISEMRVNLRGRTQAEEEGAKRRQIARSHNHNATTPQAAAAAAAAAAEAAAAAAAAAAAGGGGGANARVVMLVDLLQRHRDVDVVAE